MLVRAEKIQTTSLADAPAGYLVYSSNRRPTLFWIIDATEGAYAMFLNTEYARHAFDVGAAANWRGVAIGPVEVRVDPTSANDGRGNTDTHLKASNGSLSVPVIAQPHGFNETIRLTILKIPTIENEAVYFSRWSLGMPGESPDHWIELVAFSPDGISSHLGASERDAGDN
jgi:hypothetical protein